MAERLRREFAKLLHKKYAHRFESYSFRRVDSINGNAKDCKSLRCKFESYSTLLRVWGNYREYMDKLWDGRNILEIIKASEKEKGKKRKR